ncbi:hypothetical protein BD309DRAFT_997826 [Dichomitus squalens]|nr:hypothetical protein BD309DRAFT_997826 [Dichomitus squalens]
MKPRDYCCCAIPVVYAGIYIALLEQFVLGVTAGVLSIATTDIVGASTPSFAKWLFAIICWIAAGVQIFGFVAVRQERPIFYRRYQAQSKCIADFFGNTISANNSEGQTLCDIFPWVDVGIMGGLWVLFAIVQTYLYVVVSSFGKGQRRDHTRYSSLLNESSKSMTIPLTDRGAWDPRTSMENLVQPSGHARHDSDASVATVMADKPQGYSDYPPHVPGNAYTQEPGPTPRVYDSYYDNYNATGGVGYPERSQAHPGEL